MSTRALINILNANDEVICAIYKHWDGYPEDPGVGHALKEFLEPIRIVNGLSTLKDVANGMECLAAQVVAHLKGGPGDIYLYPPNTCDIGEEYIYTVKQVDGRPVMSWQEV